MAYVKTNWAEDTPITAVALNNMETGIANALEKTGGAIRGSVLSIQAATPTGWSDFRVKRQIGDTTLEAILGAGGTLNDGLALMVQAGEIKKALNLSTNGGIWWDNYVIYHAGNLSPLQTTGGNVTGNIVFNNERGVQVKDSSGNDRNGVSIQSSMTRVGDTAVPLVLQSSENPQTKVGTTFYKLYHAGNPQPSAKQWNGKQMRAGTYTAGASGYITFGY